MKYLIVLSCLSVLFACGNPQIGPMGPEGQDASETTTFVGFRNTLHTQVVDHLTGVVVPQKLEYTELSPNNNQSGFLTLIVDTVKFCYQRETGNYNNTYKLVSKASHPTDCTVTGTATSTTVSGIYMLQPGKKIQFQVHSDQMPTGQDIETTFILVR